MPVNIPETPQKRIVIIGAGFAGLKLAKKLVGSGFQIVLIDKNNYHQFQSDSIVTGKQIGRAHV